MSGQIKAYIWYLTDKKKPYVIKITYMSVVMMLGILYAYFYNEDNAAVLNFRHLFTRHAMPSYINDHCIYFVFFYHFRFVLELLSMDTQNFEKRKKN